MGINACLSPFNTAATVPEEAVSTTTFCKLALVRQARFTECCYVYTVGSKFFGDQCSSSLRRFCLGVIQQV
ncbi:hypothetical protein ACOMHN_003016 [Nucella lapillus]